MSWRAARRERRRHRRALLRMVRERRRSWCAVKRVCRLMDSWCPFVLVRLGDVVVPIEPTASSEITFDYTPPPIGDEGAGGLEPAALTVSEGKK